MSISLDMLVLYAKRQARLITGGKKTIVYKDGRVLDAGRLDRFGERHYLDAEGAEVMEVATPVGYTYATPAPAIADEELYKNTNHPLFKFFHTERNVQAIFGHVLDDEDHIYSAAHVHQVGVFGLEYAHEPPLPSENLPLLLKDCLLLAKDLMGLASSPSTCNGLRSSLNHTLQGRASKFHITCTGTQQDTFTIPMQDRILSYLRNSGVCTKLLQLSQSDQAKWKKGWCPMTPEELSESELLYKILFGLLSEYNNAMTFMHINVLMAGSEDSAGTILTRLSLGIDTRGFSERETCQWRVISIDCISSMRAVQVNVPLRSTWMDDWEPAQIYTTESTEHLKWSDCVYSLRGWFFHLSSYFRKLEYRSEHSDEDYSTQEDNSEIGEEAWDPMDACVPLATFQPHSVSVPAVLSADNDFNLAILEQFDPNDADDDVWEP